MWPGIFSFVCLFVFEGVGVFCEDVGVFDPDYQLKTVSKLSLNVVLYYLACLLISNKNGLLLILTIGFNCNLYIK